MVETLARSWCRHVAAAAVLAAALLALHACSWIEWQEEPLVGEAAPPAETAEAPPPAETGFMPAKPPPPRPAPPLVEGRHTVKRGETLFSIARLYDVDTYTLASRNRLRPPYTLEAGQVLAVPRAEATAAPAATAPAATAPAATAPAVEVSPLAPTGPTAQPLPPVRPPSASTDGGAPRTTAAEAVRPPPVGNEARAGFLWPVSGEVVRGFGPRQDGSRSDGIDIRVKRPTAVRAARQGRVHYAGNQLKSYGNIVLIAHDDQWWTLYAHVDEILVSENDVVKQGDTIARITSASEAQPAILHFEVRDRTKKPVDPMRHLPRQRV
jgi:lipoprotein NlpD